MTFKLIKLYPELSSTLDGINQLMTYYARKPANDILLLYMLDRKLSGVPNKRLHYRVTLDSTNIWNGVGLPDDGGMIYSTIYNTKLNKEARKSIIDNLPSDIKHLRATTMAMMQSPRDKSFVVGNDDSLHMYLDYSDSTTQQLREHAYAVLHFASKHLDQLKFKDFYLACLDNAVDVTSAAERYITPVIQSMLDELKEQQFNLMLAKLQNVETQSRHHIADKIADVQADIREWEKTLMNKQNKLDAYMFELFQFDAGIASSTMDELVDYIRENKRDSLIDVDIDVPNDKLLLTIKGPIRLTEEKTLRTLIDSKLSNHVNSLDKYLQDLLLDIAKGNLTCMMYGVIALDLTRKMYTVVKNIEAINSNAMHNVHWSSYGCVGNLKTPLKECIANRNWIPMYELLCTAVGNINAADGVVFPKFVRRFKGSVWDELIFTDKLGKQQSLAKWKSDYQTKEEVPF